MHPFIHLPIIKISNKTNFPNSSLLRPLSKTPLGFITEKENYFMFTMMNKKYPKELKIIKKKNLESYCAKLQFKKQYIPF